MKEPLTMRGKWAKAIFVDCVQGIRRMLQIATDKGVDPEDQKGALNQIKQSLARICRQPRPKYRNEKQKAADDAFVGFFRNIRGVVQLATHRKVSPSKRRQWLKRLDRELAAYCA